MPAMIINLEGDNAWPDLANSPNVIHLGNDAPAIHVALLSRGMKSGRPSVCFRLELPDRPG